MIKKDTDYVYSKFLQIRKADTIAFTFITFLFSYDLKLNFWRQSQFIFGNRDNDIFFLSISTVFILYIH